MAGAKPVQRGNTRAIKKEDNDVTPQKQNQSSNLELNGKETQSQTPIKQDPFKKDDQYKLKLREDFNPLDNDITASPDEKGSPDKAILDSNEVIMKKSRQVRYGKPIWQIMEIIKIYRDGFQNGQQSAYTQVKEFCKKASIEELTKK